MVRESDQQLFLLADLPPSKWQIGLALGIVAALVVAFAITAPFAATQLPRIDAFIPALETAIVIADLITSALLFAQFSIVRRFALLVLADGYLFTGLIVTSHALSFPGAFAPKGVFGDGLQTTAWLYYFWKISSPVAVIAYVFLKDAKRTTSAPRPAPVAAIGWSATAVIVMAYGLTWIAAAGEWFLPRVHVDTISVATVVRHLFGVLDISLVAIALALLWLRRRSVLDLWLMVTCCTLMLEIAMAIMLVNTRYSLGFYASRFYALIATIVVLLLFFCETTILYAVLAQTMIRQRRERESRQVAMDSMAAAIAHELKQPLAAISAYGYAAMRWMEKPDFDEMRVSIKCMISNAHHASEVIDGIRSLFKKDTRGRAWLDVNELVRQVLKTVDAHLRTQRVSVSTELREGLPQLFANRVQLEEMFVNLIMNAIEAMNSVTDRARLLRISSDIIHEPSSVQVTVEDAGMGLGKDKERIFEAFYTTKSEGTGIGLAICRAIVETHGGSLHASANKPYGTIFHVALPTGGGVRAPVPGTAHG